MTYRCWMKRLINHAMSLEDPRYRGVPLLLSRPRRSVGGEAREAGQSLEHLNLKMMGLDIRSAYESSFNQIARRLARSGHR